MKSLFPALNVRLPLAFVVLGKINAIAFLDGYYFAFVLRNCYACKICANTKGNDSPIPLKIRPCETVFGLMYMDMAPEEIDQMLDTYGCGHWALTEKLNDNWWAMKYSTVFK